MASTELHVETYLLQDQSKIAGFEQKLKTSKSSVEAVLFATCVLRVTWGLKKYLFTWILLLFCPKSETDK